MVGDPIDFGSFIEHVAENLADSAQNRPPKQPVDPLFYTHVKNATRETEMQQTPLLPYSIHHVEAAVPVIAVLVVNMDDAGLNELFVEQRLELVAGTRRFLRQTQLGKIQLIGAVY